MFKATNNEFKLEVDNMIELKKYQEIETINGWVCASKLNIGDKIITSDGSRDILSIKELENNIMLEID